MTDKQRSKTEKEREERRLQRALSFRIAREYCSANGLSVEKLKNQEFYSIYGSAFFAQPSNVVPDGLCNDKETMPLVTLILNPDNNDNIEIKQTEFTKKYLSL